MGKLYDLKEATYRFFEKKRKEKIDEDKKKDVYEYTYSNKDKNFLEQEFIERDDRGDVVVKPGDRKLKEEINIKKLTWEESINYKKLMRVLKRLNRDKIDIWFSMKKAQRIYYLYRGLYYKSPKSLLQWKNIPTLYELIKGYGKSSIEKKIIRMKKILKVIIIQRKDKLKKWVNYIIDWLVFFNYILYLKKNIVWNLWVIY